MTVKMPFKKKKKTKSKKMIEEQSFRKIGNG
jgi:hypothetical protein